VKRLHQSILIISTLLASWLGMQAVHEAGHVLAALATGGRVAKVVLHPLTISRTDLAHNPSPLPVVWAGPLVGVVAPLAGWGAAAVLRVPGAFVLRFFAGFCVGDCGEMLRHGSSLWSLWLFGAVTMPAGLWLWHRQGPHFGLGAAEGQVNPAVAYASLVACAALLILGLVIDGE